MIFDRQFPFLDLESRIYFSTLFYPNSIPCVFVYVQKCKPNVLYDMTRSLRTSLVNVARAPNSLFPNLDTCVIAPLHSVANDILGKLIFGALLDVRKVNKNV